MDIYNKTVPYFYIIRNKDTGIMYAGSKWERGCNQNSFMKESGYQTSSKTINLIISQFGLGIFEILRIDTYCDGLHVYDYESIFLQTNNCASSNNWYNFHNNEKLSPTGSERFKNLMMDKFGVENCMELPETKEKIKITNIEKYGTESHNSNLEIKEKKKQKYLKLYGVDHPSKILKLCCHCGEVRGITHEKNCKLNPNKKQRKYYDITGKNNPMAKKFILVSPNGETFVVEGNICRFCKQIGMNWGYLRDKKTHKGWTWEEVEEG